MAQEKSHPSSPTGATRQRDPLDEVRKAVRADRRKIECVPLGSLALKTTPTR